MRGFDVEDTNAAEPSEVHLTRIDVPFLELTWFFIKASLAMALAFSVTSWLWVMIGTGMIALSAGLLFLLGVPRLFVPPTEAASVELSAPVPAAEPPPAPAEPPPAPADAPSEAVPPTQPPPPSDPPPAPSGGTTRTEATPEPVVIPADGRDPNREATEAAQREELERLRRERER